MLLPLVALAALAPMTLALREEEDEEFATLRPPVLGFAIERAVGREAYRLVEVAAGSGGAEASETDGAKAGAGPGGRRVLCVGSLDECEERLVRALEERYGDGHPNLRAPTLGGMQLWADVFWHAGWRIQENVYTGHCRLLSPGEERVAWGGYEACRAAFERERVERGVALASDDLVVLLHGLGRTHQAFAPMEDELREHGYEVASLAYPSTRRSIAEHADGLNRVLDRLEGVRRVSFVAHSLGSIVARAALARPAAWRDRIELGRVVMLAPPSRGSAAARLLRDLLPFRAIAGPAGVELAGELAELPEPPCPFGIVAAARGGEGGWNPLLEGADDGVLSVAETALPGAADATVIAGTHTFMMRSRAAIAAVLAFLETGRFPSSEPGEPR